DEGGEGVPKLLAEGRLVEHVEVQLAQYPGGPPVVPQPRVAVPVRAVRLRRERHARTRPEVRQVVVEAVGVQLDRVHQLALPADDAVVEPSLARVLRVAEQLLVARDIEDRPQLRRRYGYPTVRVTPDEVAGHVPAL